MNNIKIKKITLDPTFLNRQCHAKFYVKKLTTKWNGQIPWKTQLIKTDLKKKEKYKKVYIC